MIYLEIWPLWDHHSWNRCARDRLLFAFTAFTVLRRLPAPPRLRKSKYKARSFWTPSLEWKKITERHVQYRFPVNLPAVTVKVEVVSADIYGVWLLSSVSQQSFTGLHTQTQFGSHDASLVSYFLYLCHEPFLILTVQRRLKPFIHQFSQFSFSIL